MAGTKIVALILLIGGVLALIYGGFTYTKSESEANIGPIELEVKDRERVNIPMWAGVLGVVIGGVMLMAPGKKA
jgi:hypothetical protein